MDAGELGVAEVVAVDRPEVADVAAHADVCAEPREEPAAHVEAEIVRRRAQHTRAEEARRRPPP